MCEALRRHYQAPSMGPWPWGPRARGLNAVHTAHVLNVVDTAGDLNAVHTARALNAVHMAR
eukprot:12032029-Karenia_brevis.AAC.1